MPVDLDQWRKNVWGAASSIGDGEFQRLAWIENDPRYFSNPGEIYCKFFDDAAIEEFLRWPEIELTAEQRGAAQQLIDRMKEFDALGGVELPPEKILSHLVWQEVQRCGSRLGDLLYPDGPPSGEAPESTE